MSNSIPNQRVNIVRVPHSTRKMLRISLACYPQRSASRQSEIGMMAVAEIMSAVVEGQWSSVMLRADLGAARCRGRRVLTPNSISRLESGVSESNLNLGNSVTLSSVVVHSSTAISLRLAAAQTIQSRTIGSKPTRPKRRAV